jgi:hypothetical protein
MVGAPPGLVWASWLPSRDTTLQVLPFHEKIHGIFSRFYFLQKLDKNETLLKTTSDLAVFIKVW